MNTTRDRAQGAVKVRCGAGHVVTCPPSAVRVSHSRGVLLGHEIWCDQCGTLDSVLASPLHISLLLEMGVRIAADETDCTLPLVGEARRVLSMKYLLDDEAMKTLADVAGPQELIERQ